MISASLYSYVYLLLLTVLTIGCSLKYANYSESRITDKSYQQILPSLMLMVFMIIFIGFRPLDNIFIDMNNYNRRYNAFINLGDDFTVDFEVENLIFDNILNLFASAEIPIEFFFTFIAAIYFSSILLAVRRLFPNDTLYSYVIYLSAFSTFSYGTNGIKAGVAAAIFLVALAYRNKVILSAILALISLGFHHSMYMVIIGYILTFIVKNPKYYLGFWFFTIICSAVHFNPLYSFMVSFADDGGNKYLTSTDSDWGGKIGFRLDFLLYSAVPIAIGFYSIYKCKITNGIYNMWFNLYTFSNSLWCLCMYIPFNNRIAYLSWFMLPIVSIYPMLKLTMHIRQYYLLNVVVWVYLIFSIFMSLT